jgi:hypothetical protein
MTPPPADQSVWRDEEEMVAAISALYPETDPTTLRFHRSGWDSVAIESAGQLFKFPREADALAALRREVAILALVRRLSPLPVPDMKLHEAPKPFSEHAILPGEHLVSDQYERLSETQRDHLASALAGFYAALHTIAPADAMIAGAVEIEAWSSPAEVARLTLPTLHQWAVPAAKKIIDAYAADADKADDQIYGFFDGHGWNMAFNHATGTLNGIYDFADSGIGRRHQEFVYSSFISWDLTQRMISHYKLLTGFAIDREHVRTLTGYHRLWELAVAAETGEAFEDVLASALTWLKDA